MAAKNKLINPAELKGVERIFQVDRDTILIYTGIHPGDARPFARIGAGYALPAHLLPLVEHVILPETHLWNIGVEDAWLRTVVDGGSGKIHYVGSKERVTQLQRYFDIEAYLKMKEKQAQERAKESGQERKKSESAAPAEIPVEYDVYKAPLGVDNRNKCIITYLATGDYQVAVGSSRVLDSGSYFRSRITLDKEYAMISKALAKFEEPARSGYSFFPFDGEGLLSNLWNFNGALLFAEPVPEYHYRLLEQGINSERVSMAISGSVYQPGFLELLRRSDVTGRIVGVSTPDAERLSLVKRIYNFCQPKIFSEGGALPLARNVSFYESRTRSHAAFVFRPREDAENPVQILFPFLKTKESRAFDFIKGPFDLEFVVVDEIAKMKQDYAGAAVLFARGGLPEKAWNSLHFSEGRYPIVPACEYRLRQVLRIDDIADGVRAALAGTEFETPVLELLSNLGVAEALEDLSGIRDSLYIIRTQPIPRDPVLLMSLGSVLSYIREVVSRKALEDRSVVDLVNKVASRFSLDRLKFGSLAVFPGQLQFDVLMHTGIATVVVAQRAQKAWNVHFQLPPDPETAVAQEKEFRKFLKEQQKIVDKIGTANDRALIDLLEKLFEETLHRGRERLRLYQLLESLTIANPAAKVAPGLPFYMKLPYWMRRVVEMLQVPQLMQWVSENKNRLTGKRAEKPAYLSKAALWIIGAGLILTAAYGAFRWTAGKIGQSISESGGRSAFLQESLNQSAQNGGEEIKKN